MHSGGWVACSLAAFTVLVSRFAAVILPSACFRCCVAFGVVVWLGSALGCGPAAPAETEALDLVAAVDASRASALVVLDLERDTVLVSLRADSLRPAPGLAGFVTALAAEDLPPAAREALRPASALRMRRLPGLEPAGRDSAMSLDDLLNAALRGDRVAGDEALAVVGRRAVEAAAPEGVEPPLPLGGLILAWAPERRGSETLPDDRAATFLALSRAAQRDSAFARDRAFLNSTAYRSAETLRLERRGLGLSEARYEALVEATAPRATASALAGLLIEHPTLRERLSALGGDMPRTAVGRLGALGAAVCLSADGRRLGVLLWDSTLGETDPPAGLARHLRR